MQLPNPHNMTICKKMETHTRRFKIFARSFHYIYKRIRQWSVTDIGGWLLVQPFEFLKLSDLFYFATIHLREVRQICDDLFTRVQPPSSVTGHWRILSFVKINDKVGLPILYMQQHFCQQPSKIILLVNYVFFFSLPHTPTQTETYVQNQNVTAILCLRI